MLHALLADLVLLAHALFVLFVLLGGFLVLRRPWFAICHLPAVIWGVVIELGGCVCPLTYLENHFRRLGGESGYGTTCIEHYLEPILYPMGLTAHVQLLLGMLLLSVNLAVYVTVWRRRRR
jgi:hypothetical protein